ncbi:uncharacterized protein LOC133922882 [Phragmites australis]|uniref:uncharacterized protein LOC133922882 n=1 Tax=Phragmites australis TaxID=29695 RepID=UPI002D797163|nr:uncharacterized protein LOC133922882 [Phragmites australis]
MPNAICMQGGGRIILSATVSSFVTPSASLPPSELHLPPRSRPSLLRIHFYDGSKNQSEGGERYCHVLGALSSLVPQVCNASNLFVADGCNLQLSRVGLKPNGCTRKPSFPVAVVVVLQD